MAEQVVVEAETVQDWAVQPTDDGRRKAVVFKVETGSAGFSFPPDDFDRFAQSVIAEAGKPCGREGCRCNSASRERRPGIRERDLD